MPLHCAVENLSYFKSILFTLIYQGDRETREAAEDGARQEEEAEAPGVPECGASACQGLQGLPP